MERFNNVGKSRSDRHEKLEVIMEIISSNVNLLRMMVGLEGGVVRVDY